MQTSRITAAILAVTALSHGIAQQPIAPKTPVGISAGAQKFDGKWYLVFLEKVPWNSAREKCTTLGGQLASIPDQQTWDFIRQLGKGADLWIGGSDEETQGVWKWVDGTSFTFTAWLKGQPDRAYGGQEHYVHITRDGWNDCRKSGVINEKGRVVGYICEWKDR